MSQEVVIIGAGVIGLSTAYHAAQAGFKVRVVDRGSAVANGCSFGNAGMIVPSHFIPMAAPGMVAMGLKWMWNPESPFYIKPRLSPSLLAWAYRFWRAATPAHVQRCAPVLRDLHLASRSEYESLAENGVHFTLVKKGLLMLCKSPATLEEEGHVANKARGMNVPAEVLDAAQTSALDPNITMDVAGSVYYPLDCHLSPNELMAALLTRCQDMGVEFHWNTQLTGWKRNGTKLHAALTSAGEMSADHFVLCGGIWSSEMLDDLRLKLPMQAGKGYSLTVPQPAQLATICSILTEARIAVTPMGSTMRFGGTMEMAGLDETVTARRVQGIIKSVPRYYPAFSPSHFESLPAWHGLRPCSPDGMPYLGPTRAASNLIVATAHAMMGLSLAPITGKIVANFLTQSKQPIDLSLLSPDRYS